MNDIFNTKERLKRNFTLIALYAFIFIAIWLIFYLIGIDLIEVIDKLKE